MKIERGDANAHIYYTRAFIKHTTKIKKRVGLFCFCAPRILDRHQNHIPKVKNLRVADGGGSIDQLERQYQLVKGDIARTRNGINSNQNGAIFKHTFPLLHVKVQQKKSSRGNS